MRLSLLLACAWLALGSPSATTAGGQPADPVEQLVARLDAAVAAGNSEAVRPLLRPEIPAMVTDDFVATISGVKPDHAVVKERDRAELPGRQRLLLEIFTDRGGAGQVSTWRMDVAPRSLAAPEGEWEISGIEKLTVVNGLYRLALDTATEYDVTNLVLTAPDLSISLPSGHAFLARTPDGPTAVVFLGRAHVDFAPHDEAERGQVHIFSGNDAFRTDLDAFFIRVNPVDFGPIAAKSLTARRPDAGRARRAAQLFDDFIGKTFLIDLNDLSGDRWSLVPMGGDFVAEIVTSKYGSLTYTRSQSEDEDISLFDRRRRRNIASYASEAKLAARGPFFDEDDSVPYHVTHYDLQVSFAPDRSWVDGTARLTLHLRQPQASTLTFRLAEPLVVRSLTSPQFGRLLHLRVVGQNNVLVSFPGVLTPDSDIEIDMTYGGRLPPQSLDREAITVDQESREAQSPSQDEATIPAEPQFVYSNRSYWYPQSTVTDYATARLALTIPADMDVVASGTARGTTALATAPGQHPRKVALFEASQPARYLSCIISRFQTGPTVALPLPDADDPVALSVTANAREANRIRGYADRAGDILTFYSSVMHDAPYSSFTVALTESDLPGGHSPAYFAMLNLPLPSTPFVWNNDPVAFNNVPSFFLAHEVAHQWWGQAVGWKNYHEQWLSEGFAQYFAAMYADHERGPDTFVGMLRQMRRWAIEMSPQGPVYLGYRLGHIKGDSRVFRALVYNKGAMVLHMLRHLMGDAAFFKGLRNFYTTWRFEKAGTDDLRIAMEKASGLSLSRFFDRWIYHDGIPRVAFASEIDAAAGAVHVRFEQKGDTYDFPATVTLIYADGTAQDTIVPVTDRVVERTIQARAAVRAVEVNRDSGSLAEFTR